MAMEEMVIRNGTVVTASGIVEADIWIEGGKIKRVAKDRLSSYRKNGQPPQEWDAAGMYILPGFLSLPDKAFTKIRSPQDYLSAVRSLVAFGYTSMADLLQIDSWKKPDQWCYQAAVHYNNVIDYTIVVEIPARQMTHGLIRQLCAEGYRSIRMTVHKPEEIFRLEWETFSPLLASYKVLLTLHIPDDTGITREEKRNILRHWLRHCRVWHIRTWVKADWTLAVEAPHSFYHLYQIKGMAVDHALRLLHEQPFRPLAVMASLEAVQVDLKRKRWQEAELLRLLVKLCSTNTAKALGLYPRKGCIVPGADADLLFLKKEQLLTKFDLYTILNFSELRLPTSVMSNGKWIFAQQEYAATIGMGRCHRDIKPYNFVM
ncbi:amidohydrolase family protein [Brevibacillus borstelensis]|uniref:amidohydrolase family protein n=1 Tax=Brevibacillus borstelensis TaxID=45462 RepID=UPI0030C28C76